ncbi:MAG: hypothetical protein ACOYT4_01040 [Nanoarchaeota archaeon]
MNKKAQAGFEISLLIVSIFAFAFLIAIPTTNGASVISQPSACCEKISGKDAFCINAKESECDNSINSETNQKYKISPTSCESTSYCKQGTCYDSSEGICMENTPRRVCEENGGAWDQREIQELPQCQLGCCIISDQAAFVTLTRCKQLSSFFGVEIDYRKDISTEMQCIAQAQAQDMGACVYEQDAVRTCKFTTRKDCNAPEIAEGLDLEMTSEKRFYKDYLCSAEELNTDCARQSKTGCYNGDVYWLDSCGNRENVYFGENEKAKDESWNNGRVTEADKICRPSPDGKNVDCGNCEYLQGTRCAKYEKGLFSLKKPKYGDYYCQPTYCEEEGIQYKNGESWCVYDGAQGNGKDPVGSRHFRKICIDGEIHVEPCEDFRNEICIQDKVEIDDGTYSNAICRVNRWQDCVLVGNREDCENINRRDCIWKENVKGIGNLCVPNVPPGLKFWEEGDAQSICGAASRTIVVKYEKSNLLDSWDCIENCEFDPKKSDKGEPAVRALNGICTNLGDCGGYVNYAGKFTHDGYNWNSGGNKKFSPNSINILIQGVAKPSYIISVFAGFALFQLVKAGESGEAVKPSESEVCDDSIGVCDDSSIQNVIPIESEDTSPKNSWSDYAKMFGGGLFGGKGNSKSIPSTGLNPTAESGQDIAKNPEILSESKPYLKELGMSVFWAASAYGFGKQIGSKLGLNKGQSDALANALGGGTLMYSLLKSENVGNYMSNVETLGIGDGWKWLSSHSGYTSFGFSLLIFVLTYKDEKTQTIVFTCQPWQAPTSGQDCEKCNIEDLPCSEYRCRSLGQSCEIVNKGTADEKCTYVSPNDANPPKITTNEDSLSEGYEYTPRKTSSPPGPGFRIEKVNGNCISAFTSIEFGVDTDEPAQCKIDIEHKTKFEDMTYWLGENNLYLYNHTQHFALPGPSAYSNNSLIMKNDGETILFIRCRDKKGNENSAEYAVEFCVDPTPDSTAPKIMATSISNNGCVAENSNYANVEFYVNEPSECKWSHEDKSYDNMENNMRCDTNLYEINALDLYTCKANLTGIGRESNNFYIRCKDQPGAPDNDGNRNMESFKFALKGSNALKMQNLQPNGTISAGVDPAPVYLNAETLFGCSEGKAYCYYATEDKPENYIQFFETNDIVHKQRLDLSTGNYTYYIKCVDEGGNLAKESTTFRVEVQTGAPLVARVYEEDNMLKIRTVRKSECAYSLDNCDFSFAEGTQMPYANSTDHVAEWKEDKTYYIKCRDEFMNEPSDCSIVVRPSKLNEE